MKNEEKFKAVSAYLKEKHPGDYKTDDDVRQFIEEVGHMFPEKVEMEAVFFKEEKGALIEQLLKRGSQKQKRYVVILKTPFTAQVLVEADSKQHARDIIEKASVGFDEELRPGRRREYFRSGNCSAIGKIR